MYGRPAKKEISSYDESLEKTYWNTQSKKWTSKIPPIRPSPNDLESYEAFLTKIKKPTHVLLLGTTVELRRLVRKIFPDSEVLLWDFSPAMLKASGHQENYSLKEKVFLKNWLDHNSPGITFDLILGDRVFEQLTQDIEERFVKRLAEFLETGGAFITRCRFADDSQRNTSMAEIILRSETELKDLPYKEAATALFLRLHNAAGYLENRTVHFQNIIQDFSKFLEENEAHRSSPILLQTYRKLVRSKRLFPFKWAYTAPTKDQFMKIISTDFFLEEERRSGDYIDSHLYPTILMKKH